MNGKIITIDKLAPGDSAVVDHIEKSSLSDRLASLGLVPGTRVDCLYRAPFGDPVAYGIRGAVIALRSADGRTVHARAGGIFDG